MANYSYVAVTVDGKQKKGSLEAKDEEKVRSLLKSEGLIPISVKEQSAMTRDLNISIGGKIKDRDIAVFCRQFSSILNAGVTVVEALNMLADQTENKKLADGIRETRAGVQRGETLGNSMRATKNIFPSILINMVDAGEASGSLDIAFNRMATHFEKSARLAALVKKALIYPIVLLVVTFIVVIAMSVYVVPKFATLFADLGSDLPGITKFVMAISDFFRYKWYIALAIVVIVVVAIKLFKATETGKVFFGKLALKVPIFGKLNIKNGAASMARTLSTLTSTGISLPAALDITARSLSNILMQRALEKARTEVEQGVALSEPLKRSEVFPPMVYQMTSIGEETGNIEGMLTKVADYYEEEVEITTQSLTALMEPLIIVVMGVIIGFIVIALYMPMIDMYSGMDQLGI